ncbi:hypothetical protein [Anatilimnocola floriformis]|uniref:hypothetical protein n=1 Tax=Anatilimnocola floriformis TaxID=2948575 RepID=UPI0020C48514|nr:hypothetical protein [Anatilimnocola floriformis]
MNRTFIIIALLTAAVAPGCRSWPGFNSPWAAKPDAPPVLFSAIPAKEELIAALNVPYSKVQALQTQGATISVSGIPNIGADISLQQPGRFRFKASSSFMGQLVDMGSNDEMLWFWTSQGSPPDVFFARHDRLAMSPLRQRLAIDPSMITEAFGLLDLKPEQVIGEPTTAGKDRLQLVCRQHTPGGDLTRTLLIHNKQGYLLEQRITDAAGRPVVNARLSQQRHYQLDGVTLPHEIDLHIPSGDMRVTLRVPRYGINQPFPNGEATFAFPREQLAQHRMVDIADPNFLPPGQQPPAQYSSPGYPPPMQPGMQPVGYPQQQAAPPGYQQPNPQPAYPPSGYPPGYQPPRAAAQPAAQPLRGRLY